jgi:hypothetical protein
MDDGKWMMENVGQREILTCSAAGKFYMVKMG